MRSNRMGIRVQVRPLTGPLVVIACAMAGAAAWSSAAYGAGGATGLVTQSGTEYTLVLDPRQSSEAITQRLASAGHLSISRIPGLPPRFAHYRLITVPAADQTTKNQLLAVDGVLAVRNVHRCASLDYPILETGQIIAKFKPGTPYAQVQSTAARHGCTVRRQFALLNQVYVLNLNDTTITGMQCAAALAAEPNVVFSHPSLLFKLEKHAESIDDPLYPYQWHLQNTGQLPGATPGEDIKAPEAWEITQGQGAVIAVIDDSIQKDHEDLKDNYLTGVDMLGSTFNDDWSDPSWVVPGDSDGDPSPYFGPDPYLGTVTGLYGEFHGTCVSGIICARANNVGVRGVAPMASLVGCKIGLGSLYTTDQDVADAFIFAETNGAMAANNSWGGPGQAILPTIPNTSLMLPDLISDTIKTVSTTGRGGRGMLVLYSAGNSSMLISFGNIYGGMPQVMAIGATMRNGLIACYSDYGPDMSVCAPGGGSAAPRDTMGGGVALSDCFEADIATTDDSEVPGYWITNYDLVGNTWVFLPGYPIRGLNPPMKFLTSGTYFPGPNCIPSMPGGNFCIPQVPDNYETVDFPQQDYTRHMNGTSAACPVVTGVAALAFSINPNMTAQEARNLIEHTADRILAPNEYWDPITGHNDRYGHGRVNAYRAVQAAQAAKTWPSPIKNIQNVSSQALVRLFWEFPDWDEDGFADADAAAVLIVRALSGKLLWAPTDGVEYTVGQQVAPGVVVVANSLIDTLDQTGLQAGKYDFAFFTRNGSNYYSWGRSVTVTTTGTITMPLASISAAPIAGRAPLTTHFAAGVIDPSHGVKNLTYQWDFGDGTAISNEVTPDHTYTIAGEYFPQVTVTDSAGLSAKASTRIVVSGAANKPPQASIVASKTSGQAPLPIVFQGFGIDPDIGGFIVRYDWDFGDGSTASGQIVEHVFVAGGTYGVSLTVTDDQGASGSTSILISVSGASSTLAETDPPGTLGRSLPQCGMGLPVALLGISVGLVTMRTGRRRPT
ncbi:MAG TPA: S8 family serine peptidase [Phycisphaerae bacterium]|nr:S8 family serine peptidase [Phycisphaerae bacterium]HRY67732.1 S8 family serine peptidase [Phycisphaerae bacterium]HSA25184.1 S8 family serine peptidase [Phycisphaerae bacterium]